jgi:hypothetical protein
VILLLSEWWCIGLKKEEESEEEGEGEEEKYLMLRA